MQVTKEQRRFGIYDKLRELGDIFLHDTRRCG